MDTTTDQQPTFTAKEAAHYLRVADSTLANWRYLGTGPSFVRLGGGRGKIIYRREDLDTFLASNLVV